MVKLSNDENIKNLKKRELLRILMIIFSLLTIVLAFLNLFDKVNIVFALFSFVITVILKRVRESTEIIRKDDDIDAIKKEIDDYKKIKNK